MTRLSSSLALLAWALAGVAADPAGADPASARSAVERFARLLEDRDVRGLASLYHRDAAHRDLASGEMVRGEAALRELYAARLGAHGGAGDRVRIDAFRLLTGDVGIAQLTRSSADPAPPDAARAWPPYTVLVVSRDDDGDWGVAATRAGGNPDTHESSLPLEP